MDPNAWEDERKKIAINLSRVRGEHTVWKAGIAFGVSCMEA
jgi:hypothetical protein